MLHLPNRKVPQRRNTDLGRLTQGQRPPGVYYLSCTNAVFSSFCQKNDKLDLGGSCSLPGVGLVLCFDYLRTRETTELQPG